MNPQICPTCNSPIPANAPGGFCPACLLRDAEEPPITGRAAPSLEEIAAGFPQLEIVRLIGQGGMGFVYQVRQPGLDRTVALKILAPELGRDPAFAERFAREARVLGKLNHPNIVTVFEHGESGGFFYLLMEFVDGVNLRQAMRAGRFTPEQALAIVPGICDALQFAHEQGVWHRDIKPENILLDGRGDVKMADFGIARIVGDPQRDFTLTMTGNALGSAAYMAPEQHENPRGVDHRADIYSLGVVIYEMLTGELPLGRFPLPSQRAAVDHRIDEIVLRTLEKERELRQQSADEVKTDVQAAATTPPAMDVAPESTSPLSRLPRLVFRSLVLLIVGVALWMATEVAGESGKVIIGAKVWSSSAVLSGEFSLGLKTMAVSILVLRSIAYVAGALGFLGSLWSLYEMKRGWMSVTGRWLLIALTIVPMSAAAIAFVWTEWLDTHLVWEHASKGGLQVMMGLTSGALGLVLGVLFLLARPLRPASPRRRELGMVSIVLAALATVGGVVLTKRFDGHWPHVFHGQEARLNLNGPENLPDDQVLDLLKRAAGPFADDYLLTVSNGEARVVAITREPAAGADWPYIASAHSNNCVLRLRDLLPASAVPDMTIRPNDSFASRTGSERALDRRFYPQRTALAILAGIGVLLAAFAGGRRAAWVIAGGVALHGAMLFLPVWPVTDSRPPRLVDAPPLQPGITADELPAPDFSTPENALMSVHDARCFGRLDVVKRGVSKGLATEIEALPGGWERYMSRYPDRRFAAEKSIKMGGQTIVRGNFISRSGEQTQNPWQRIAIFEDGEWKLDNLDLANDGRAPEISAEKIFQRMNTLANEWNGREFMKLVTSDLKGRFDPLPAPEFFMEPFRGKIEMAKPLPGGTRGAHLKSKVIACIGGRDGSTYTTFTFANHGGNWLLNRWDKSIYRARVRIYFWPQSPDPESVLRAHLGATRYRKVKAEFELLADHADPDEAVRQANQKAVDLQVSLKKAGLDSTYKIIKPAGKPEKPWMGEDDLEPEELEIFPPTSGADK